MCDDRCGHQQSHHRAWLCLRLCLRMCSRLLLHQCLLRCVHEATNVGHHQSRLAHLRLPAALRAPVSQSRYRPPRRLVSGSNLRRWVCRQVGRLHQCRRTARSARELLRRATAGRTPRRSTCCHHSLTAQTKRRGVYRQMNRSTNCWMFRQLEHLRYSLLQGQNPPTALHCADQLPSRSTPAPAPTP